jgi:CO/xanthine dehydrogenase FAD-binding subunit
MIGQRFEYHAPKGIKTAAKLLEAADGQANVIAGGTWVVPELTHGIRTPAHIIDLRQAKLSGIKRVTGGGLRVGATTTYSELLGSPLVARRAALLHAMSVGVTGGAQVRNQGTIGGSACYATPSSDAPGVLVALDASLKLADANGTRDVSAARFFKGAFESELGTGELLTEIAIPAQPENARFGYYKLKFCESSWPIAIGACVLGMNDDGTVQSARLVVGGVNTKPYVVDTSALIGSAVTRDLADEVAERARQAASDPYTDVLADGAYRQQIAGVVAKRALLDAAK